MITPLVVTIDRTGDYDNFLRNLETRLPSKAQPGDVRFILHADETKELYIPRRNQRSTYQLYINPSNLQTVETATDDAHQNIAMLLRPHSSESGYYVIWENPQTILLIKAPAPTVKRQVSKPSNYRTPFRSSSRSKSKSHTKGFA